MKRSTLLFAAIAAGAIFARAQAPITQPPEPVDPSPINGETYYLVNQLSGLQVDVNGSSKLNGDYVSQNTRSFSSLTQRWAMTKLVNGNWKISNISSGLCLDSKPGFYGSEAAVVQDPCGIDVPTQEWSFSYTTNG
ncbi:MAG TPA: RICIN domain-containing protein, partial [Silvibacterium sp.]|nr:RICIN domain-containing protein [Silvibacterium sp.]